MLGCSIPAAVMIEVHADFCRREEGLTAGRSFLKAAVRSRNRDFCPVRVESLGPWLVVRCEEATDRAPSAFWSAAARCVPLETMLGAWLATDGRFKNCAARP